MQPTRKNTEMPEKSGEALIWIRQLGKGCAASHSQVLQSKCD